MAPQGAQANPALVATPLHWRLDPPSWEKIHRWIDGTYGDRPDLAERHETVDWYRDLLGADWPGFANKHPLAGWLGIDSPIEYRRMAEQILDLPHARETARGLGGSQKATFDSALQTLYIASGLHRCGKLVELLGVGRGVIIPDLRTRLRERWVVCELTVMQPSNLLTTGWEFWDRLYGLQYQHARRATGRVHITFEKHLSPPRRYFRDSGRSKTTFSASPIRGRAVRCTSMVSAPSSTTRTSELVCSSTPRQ